MAGVGRSSHKAECEQMCPQTVVPEITQTFLPLSSLGMTSEQTEGKMVAYFSSPNTGQPATFSDLNLTHTAAVSVPLPSWVCFWPELAS